MGDMTLLKVLVQFSLGLLITFSFFQSASEDSTELTMHTVVRQSPMALTGRYTRLQSAFIKLSLVVLKMAGVNTIRQQWPLINCLPKCFCESHQQCSQLHGAEHSLWCLAEDMDFSAPN